MCPDSSVHTLPSFFLCTENLHTAILQMKNSNWSLLTNTPQKHPFSKTLRAKVYPKAQTHLRAGSRYTMREKLSFWAFFPSPSKEYLCGHSLAYLVPAA